MQLFPVLRDTFGGYIAAQLANNPPIGLLDTERIYKLTQTKDGIISFRKVKGIVVFEGSFLDCAKYFFQNDQKGFLYLFSLKENTFRRTRIPKAAYFHIVKRMEKVGYSFEFLDIQKNEVRGFVKEEGIKREFLMSKDENGKWDIVIYVDFVNGVEIEPTEIKDVIKIVKPRH